ncbi:MAG: hypothetical protein AAB492_03730 [Patescibacteria group bacterium]
MNLKQLRNTIQTTRLFSDAQKVDLLVKLDEASLEDQTKLEAGIDVFDREYEKRMAKRKEEMQALLGEMVEGMTEEEATLNQQAIAEIVVGMGLLTTK